MSWTAPADFAVGHLVTAAEWDALLGTTGSLASIRPAYESQADGSADPRDNTWTSLASVTFDVYNGDMVLLLGAITNVDLHVDVAAFYWVQAKIDRTAGAGGTIVQPVIAENSPPIADFGVPLTPWATFAAAADGQHTFATQICIETDLAVGPHHAHGSLLAVKFGVPLTPF